MKKFIYSILRGAVNNHWADKPPPPQKKGVNLCNRDDKCHLI